MAGAAAGKPGIPVHSVEIRRGQLGRWIPVPAGSPPDIADIGSSIFSLSSLLDPVLESHRDFKNERYAKKKADPKYIGPRIVAEGDSWFEYPYNDDVVMILGEKYAIMSLAKAGDAWADLYKKNELFAAVSHEKPHIVMLSIGGNDVMGQIENYILPYKLNRPAAAYILPSFKDLLKFVQKQYETTITPILALGAQVIVHGYDYPDPREVGEQGAQWVGPPLKSMRKIDGVELWREIANVMIDRFNEMLKAMVAQKQFDGLVHYVDLRGTIGTSKAYEGPDRNLWCDEIHGTAKGFGKIAKKFEKKIEQITKAMVMA